jgi:hypothetical protein
LSNIPPTIQSLQSVTKIHRGRRVSGICRLSFALVLVLFWAASAFAIPFNDYRDRVKEAINSLERLAQPREILSEAQRTEFIAANIRGAREALPGSERVEWQGTSFAVDNSWLDDDLKEWEAMQSADANRARVLDRIHERLQALYERLEETDKGDVTGGLSKDEMQGRLAAILQRSEYAGEVRRSSSALERFFRWLVKLINNLLPRNRQLSPGGAGIITTVAQIFVAVLAVAVIVYCIRLIAPYLVGRRRPRKKTKAQARVVLGEHLEPDQSGADLLAEAEALARSGDLRGAIRKGYIALLVELGDRKVISLAQYKTNRDYLRSVREIENLHGHMLKLTSSFELHWYGLAQASESDWTAFRAFYRAALASS